MSIKGFMAARAERGFETMAEAPPQVPASSPAPRTVSPPTSVDASSEVEGRLRSRQMLRIDGRVKGVIECEKAVLVGETARVEARIAADEVHIAGLVEGDIAARRKITLHRTAVVTGDLTTPGIVIEEGAKLKGRIVIGSDAEPAAVDAAVEPQSARDPKKAQPLRKPAPVAAKPGEAPASQAVPTSA